MLARLHRLGRDRAGNVLVELALILPFIVALIIGVVDFGRGVYTSMSLKSAARVATEYVSRTGGTAGVDQVVADAANIDPAELTVTPTLFCECEDGKSATCGGLCVDGTSVRQFISIEVEQPYTPILPYPGFTDTLTLSGRAILRVK